MEIRASFHAATLNLAPNVAKSVEDSIGSGEMEVVMEEVKVCVISKKKNPCVRFAFSDKLDSTSMQMFAWLHESNPAFKYI